MGNIKGIIFDYGGTIDSRGDHWSEVIWDCYKSAHVRVDKSDFRKAYVETERDFARTRLIMPSDTFADVMRKKIGREVEYLVSWGAMNGESAQEKAQEIAQKCYEAARRSVEAAREVLDELSVEYPLVLVSNFYGNIESVLADFDLARYFKAVIESAVVGVRKPDPAIFKLGVDALGLRAEEVLVVGDSYSKDIVPARSLGCATAWLKGRGWSTEEDSITDPAEIATLNELIKKLNPNKTI